MTLALSHWLRRRSSDYWTKRNANRDTRWQMRQNSRSFPKGKGNRAWKRAAALERAWRRSGGFYVSDFITL